MFAKLTGTNKAASFTVLVLLMALAVALYVRALDITSEFVAAWYMSTPALAVLIMLLIVTRDGYSKEGWKTLGLHRLGLKAWWIATPSSRARGRARDSYRLGHSPRCIRHARQCQ